MTQTFNNITRSDRIDTGLIELLARDLTALTAMSGDSDPENAPQDAICDNRTAGVLKLNGNVLIDYKNGFMNSTALSNTLQPLNSILTAMSSATLNVPCIITTAGGVFQVNNYGTAALNNTTITGTGALSKRNVVGTNYISDGSITQEKLETPISEESVFKCGDILYSARSGNRNGFLLLGVSRTLGSSTSSATYRSNDYYLLYHKLWVEPNAVIRNSLGAIIPKGITSSADFSSNNSVDLPSRSSAPSYEERVFTTPGAYSYTVPLGVTSLHIDCVGAAGGRGACKYTPSSSIIISKASNGGRVECDLSVTPGDTIYVYVGGAGSSAYTESEYAALPREGSETIPGGFNGGGNGLKFKYQGDWMQWAGSGGGMSDIRVGGNAIENQVVVAGGAGASVLKEDLALPPTTDATYLGGAGGGLIGGTGEHGYSLSGTGGSQTTGGLGGSLSNEDRHRDTGGNGGRGFGGSGTYAFIGGGGGYYGGGSGVDVYIMGQASSAAGGGSSYTDPNLCTNVVHTQGYSGASGDGYVIINTYSLPANAYIKY